MPTRLKERTKVDFDNQTDTYTDPIMTALSRIQIPQNKSNREFFFAFYNLYNKIISWQRLYYYYYYYYLVEIGNRSVLLCNLQGMNWTDRTNETKKLCDAFEMWHVQQVSYPGISNWDANVSTRLRSSTISLLFWRPLRNSFWYFPCSLWTDTVIWAALRRKSAIVSKSDSTQPRVVIAGVPAKTNKQT